jgi:hypothetical protein
VPLCSWGLDGAHESEADVLGYNCFLQIKTSGSAAGRVEDDMAE